MNRSTAAFLALGLAVIGVGCNKEKEAPAIIEEAPAAAAPVETDTSATLAEEPDLQKVGQDAQGAKNGGLGQAPAAEAAGFSNRGSFVVQVNVFKSARQAANLVEKLAAEGYPAYVAEVENPTPEMSGTYHRVRIGRFKRIADAKAFGESTLRPAGYDFWVDNKKNDQVGSYGYSSEPSYSTPSAPADEYRPAETPAPSSDPWGTPPAEEPAGNAWGTPSETLPGAASTLPQTEPVPEPSPDPAPADTEKVNLDEW